MSTIKSYPLWPKKLTGIGFDGEENKLCMEFFKKNSQKCCLASIDKIIFVIICSLYSL